MGLLILVGAIGVGIYLTFTSEPSILSIGLIGTYGSAYGFGTSVSPGTGQNPGMAYLTCDRDRAIDVEFITGAGTADGFGIAKDNQGNVYKLLF